MKYKNVSTDGLPIGVMSSYNIDFITSLDEATTACVVAEAIFRDLLETFTPDNVLIFFIHSEPFRRKMMDKQQQK